MPDILTGAVNGVMGVHTISGLDMLKEAWREDEGQSAGLEPSESGRRRNKYNGVPPVVRRSDVTIDQVFADAA